MTSSACGSSVSVFQAARDEIALYIAELTDSLNARKVEMFAEIASLEKEFTDKQQQKYKDLNKLDRMRAKTEEELGDNSLIGVQQRVLQELQIGIEELTVDIDNTREPDYYIEIKWGMCMESLLSQIGVSKIEVLQLTSNTTQNNYWRRRNRGNRPRQKNKGRDWDEDWERPVESCLDNTEINWDIDWDGNTNCKTETNWSEWP